MSSLLKVEDLKVSYGAINALKGLSFEVEKGSVVSLIGANGAGKSTLMNIITDNLKADIGGIFYNGEDVQKLGKDFRSVLGYMPQQQGLYDDFVCC